MIKQINDSSPFDDYRTGKVLLLFTTPGCAPCARQKMILDTLEHTLTTAGIQMAYVAAQDSPDMCQKYGIFAAPVMVLLENGLQITKYQGAQGTKDFLGALETLKWL